MKVFEVGAERERCGAEAFGGEVGVITVGQRGRSFYDQPGTNFSRLASARW